MSECVCRSVSVVVCLHRSLGLFLYRGPHIAKGEEWGAGGGSSGAEWPQEGAVLYSTWAGGVSFRSLALLSASSSENSPSICSCLRPERLEEKLTGPPRLQERVKEALERITQHSIYYYSINILSDLLFFTFHFNFCNFIIVRHFYFFKSFYLAPFLFQFSNFMCFSHFY